ncbi:hypothetical protein SMB94_003932 [Cronobacter sakazakii]|nr:hypothetical protein [Cronobacter sakazakii]ELY2540605.1 hypothetical protein [Cronobacter sakazakii]ELY4823283.1 hypothetical protein [Cronobacter sakazakii]ELY4839641.1 hypothetical protein [Cronobacter sakazakii]ELY5865295.1 hypothetical protein [Cronobacter sakazakii]
MSLNWMRHFELQILSDSGEGIIILSDFKVTFRIEWTDTRWPRVAMVKIYNLSRDTCSRILGNEFSKIKIIAGYDGLPVDNIVDSGELNHPKEIDPSQIGQTNGTNYGEIFSGEIRFTITGRDNPTDTWVLIQAIDGHQAFMNASVTKTLAAGYTVADVHAAAMDSFNPYGVKKGIAGDMPPTVFPRGRVLYQSTRDVMDNVAAQCGATWQLVDGQAQMVPTDKYVQDAIVLNSETGLIGMPQQTMGAGVNVRCLINPNIRLNGLIEIDQESIYRTSLSADEVKALPGRAREGETDGNLYVDGTIQQPSGIATDGVYVVRSISYTGDTRGQPWYMDMMCFARGDATKMNQSAQQRTL